jgi:hypothetical protein
MVALRKEAPPSQAINILITRLEHSENLNYPGINMGQKQVFYGDNK